MDLLPYLTTCEQIARECGAILKDYIGKFHVREKGRADLVTEADCASQENVRRRLAEVYPTHVLLGEENGVRAEGGAGIFRWIVDPLDGTTNYVHGDPHFCVSLAMEYDGDLQVATVYSPLEQMCYTASRGGGAFLNGQPMRVSHARTPSESLVAIGFPPGATMASPDGQAFERVMSQCQAIRRSGSTALNLAYVAAGHYDAAWNFRTNAWDMAAGVLLVQEAGGAVRQIDGSPYDVNRGSFIAAANEALLEAFLEKIHGE